MSYSPPNVDMKNTEANTEPKHFNPKTTNKNTENDSKTLENKMILKNNKNHKKKGFLTC